MLAVPLASHADWYGAEYSKCSNNPSTSGIVECVHKAVQRWDKRLNTEYKKLMERTEAPQQASLRSAQRLWIQYRDANCKFYYEGPGSISRVQSIECMRYMTKARTCELQMANRWEGPDDPQCK
ncbi:DUF1311 domain-containing protein [Alcaligenaceae bacterium]|nr:DUF1311 domain-containing protein [Alcaligenaceae bacterium]